MQRLCIARSLAQEPEVLSFDEPTSALDPISTAKIEELIMNLKKSIPIVIVTYSMQQAARVSDFTAFFYLGELIEFDRTDKIFTNPSIKRTEDYITGGFRSRKSKIRISGFNYTRMIEPQVIELLRQKHETDLETLKKQVVVETYRSRGPGGQRKNKTETAVRLRHIPTGITVTATEQRAQSQNLKLAFERLRERLHRLRQRKPQRKPTRVPLKATEKRMEGKKLHSFQKRLRKKVEKDRLPGE